jgi:site-specific DNA recombinase
MAQSTNTGGLIVAASYSRVSTQDQVSSEHEIKVSLGQQRELAETVSDKNGWRYLRDYQEPGISGEELQRPALQKMLEEARERRFQVLVVRNSDRLARANYIYQYLVHTLEQECGVQILDLNDPMAIVPPEDFDPKRDNSRVLRHGIKGMFVQYDYNQIITRLVSAKEKLAHQGRILPTYPPYGYREVWLHPTGTSESSGKPKRIFEPVESEFHVLQLIRDLFLEDGIGVTGIARRLTKTGFSTPGGGKLWGVTTVTRILENPFYAGFVAYKRRVMKPGAKSKRDVMRNPRPETIITAPHGFEAAWSKEDHQLIIERIIAQRKLAPRAKSGRNPFSPVLRCSYCGSAMRLDFSINYYLFRHKGEIQKRYYFVCGKYASHKSKLACQPNRVPFQFVADGIFTHVTHQAQNLKGHPDTYFDEISPLFRNSEEGQNQKAIWESQQKELQAKIARLETQRKRLDDLLLEDLSVAKFKELSKRLDKEDGEARDQLEKILEAQKASETQRIIRHGQKATIASVLSDWDKLRSDLEGKPFDDWSNEDIAQLKADLPRLFKEIKLKRLGKSDEVDLHFSWISEAFELGK